MKINKRLSSISDMVEDNFHILDVGCDHALLDIYLMKNKENIKVVASDINDNPLKGAKENIEKYGLEKEIEIRLGNGIETIDESINTVIISGMGGCNIVGILKYKTELLKNVSTLILSPNNDLTFVRKEITKLGYYIVDEKLIKEKNIIYPIIKFRKGKKHYKKVDYIYGPILMNKKEEIFIEYLNKEKERITQLIKILPNKYYLKKYQLKKELKLISKI